MKVKHITTFLGIILGGIIFTHGANAVVTFEGHSDVQFTFKPTMRLTLSDTSSDCPSPYESNSTFCIENLAPGNQGISNTITVNVSTNSSVGYTLSATAGGPSVDTLTTFTSNNLELPGSTPGTLADTFDMIAAGATALSAGKWGYTLDGGTTYGYLPYVNDATATPTILNKTIDAANTGDTGYTGTPNTDIQIGAYADATQLSGAYKNVVNFTAVVNIGMRTVTLAKNSSDVATVEINSVDGTAITPVTSGSWAEGQVLGITATCASGKNFLGWAKSYDFGQLADMDSAATTYAIGGGDVTLTAYCGDYQTMQNFTAANASNMSIGETRTLKDVRDGQFYTVAKLADGKVWMTSNLNLAGGTTLTSATSDVASNYTLPASSTTGFDDNSGEFVYNSNSTNCSASNGCYSYYSWLAATAGGKDASGTAVTGNGPDAAYSICPKGWRLPKSGDQSDTSNPTTTGYKKGDFYKLATAYGANLESNYYQNTTTFNTNAGPGTLPNFLLAGYYDSSSFNDGGTYGSYWSSSSSSSVVAYSLDFNSSYVNSANYTTRRLGFSVRCVFDN